MTEVRIIFPDQRLQDYLACWDTPKEARQDLFAHIIPIIEQRLLDLRRVVIQMDEFYYFNKKLKLRKAFRQSEEDLLELVEIMWKGEERKLEWKIKPASF
jgi:hypothetical protein